MIPATIQIHGVKDSREIGYFSTESGALIYWQWWDRLTDEEVGQLLGGN